MLLMANSQIQKQQTTLETAIPITQHCYPGAAKVEWQITPESVGQ